jgi:tRNA threonylcarbamoyladenosine biosynthesis protein TsaB
LASLFIDTTYDVSLGILDENLGWLKFENFSGQKVSSVIQKQAHLLLGEVGLKSSELESIITVAGPGFYTGLRLSEGFADVFKFAAIKHYSFLSYSIPKLINVPSGVWMTKAYRGEYFFHIWNLNGSKNELVSTRDLEDFLSRIDISSLYIHSESAIDDFSRSLLPNWITTQKLLRSHSQILFNSILKSDLNIDSFYFRAPEDEFKIST